MTEWGGEEKQMEGQEDAWGQILKIPEEKERKEEREGRGSWSERFVVGGLCRVREDYCLIWLGQSPLAAAASTR